MDRLIATREVDPDTVDPERLRHDLQAWAVERLVANQCEFGLYLAEFSSWNANRDPAYYLRLLYIVWSGDEVITVHIDDSKVNFAGVRALSSQAEVFERVSR